MRIVQLIFCVLLLGLLIWLNRVSVPSDAALYGGLTLVGWLSIALTTLFIGFFVILRDSSRALGFFRSHDARALAAPQLRVLTQAELAELGLDKYRGPSYPHPVIFPERCIGCQACVDACPHDVLAIVDGRAAAVAPDLCMEDTACQAECPVNPKACIVINTAKEVRSLPTPTRDGASFETNVPGCFIIGDVSGVPLIKNAVKEGADVIEHIAEELRNASPVPAVEYDVAIIGVGPAGASAAVTATERGLKYVAIEQDKVLSTIQLYPKGKYIFFKPDAKDWSGGIPVAGLGLSKAKYGSSDADPREAVIAETLHSELDSIIRENEPAIRQAFIQRIPESLRAELSPALGEKIVKELKKRVASFLLQHASDDWRDVYTKNFLPLKEQILPQFGKDIVDQLEKKIPGDQRENILNVWMSELRDKGVRINEEETCKSIVRAESGDHFVISTERGTEKQPKSYRARKIVIAIGLRGAPNRLRLPNEDIKVRIDGREQQKVLYALSNPMDFRGKRIVVVGGGNVAVEAAVDLVAVREGASIRPRDAADMNQVTVLVRDFLAPTVKFGNKYQIYECAENGLLDLRFGVGIKEMREHELVLEDVRTKKEIETIENDLVFALIGGERPNRFLESIGITIN